jgi:hypothetical protein
MRHFFSIFRVCNPSHAPKLGAKTMLMFRWAIMLLLLGAVASFIFYVATGQVKYRSLGIKVIKWTVLAAIGFFGVLVLERLL